MPTLFYVYSPPGCFNGANGGLPDGLTFETGVDNTTPNYFLTDGAGHLAFAPDVSGSDIKNAYRTIETFDDVPFTAILWWRINNESIPLSSPNNVIALRARKVSDDSIVQGIFLMSRTTRQRYRDYNHENEDVIPDSPPFSGGFKIVYSGSGYTGVYYWNEGTSQWVLLDTGPASSAAVYIEFGFVQKDDTDIPWDAWIDSIYITKDGQQIIGC